MKIYLFLNTKILSFSIPQKISGNFNFDENPEEESKLINIKEQNGHWLLYSTSESSIIVNNKKIDSLYLEPESYYILKRDNTNYLIYVTYPFDSTFQPYKYSAETYLVIGKDNNCNIKFNCPFISGIAIRLNIQNGNAILETYNNNMLYLNNQVLNSNGEYKTPIQYGDNINLYGLKIVFLKNFILLNNPHNGVSFNLQDAKLIPFHFSPNSQPLDLEIKDIDLYSQNDYFSKSPRIRRTITTKEINLSPPPRQEKEEQMPLILTIGPMLTMGVASTVMLVNNISKILIGQTTVAQSWPSLVSSSAMLISMVMWPSLTKVFNKKIRRRKKEEITKKYTNYLQDKKAELSQEQHLQKEILLENLITVNDCLNIIKNGKINFWDKRIDQNDFLEVRIGRGDELLDVKVNYPEEGFTIDEDDLRKQADAMVEEYKYIHDVPIGYSLFNSKITAFMGDKRKCYGMLNNIILQLITFYSYEDIKIVIITNEFNENNWEYARYLIHCFSNDKTVRFFATNPESSKNICDYLNVELQNRLQLSQDGPHLFKPYYIVITDDFSQIKRHNFIKTLTEYDINLGFSLAIIENQLSKLPSKCNNFIDLGISSSGILKNSFDAQEQIKFRDEINYNVNMMAIATKLSNIPIEFEEGNKPLPNVISFLEMEKVGLVEQLNIMNRWDTNDSTTSLKAEVGIDEDGHLMYLDLHEKYHGPHGLIAGMTGSGKSEFIITYILSMAINYSPDDVAFILIDYKGGGLAFAFENKATGICLPHIAGTITNLDKSEMDRTLVSIDSEIKRRQKIFNNARDKLSESTMDIYKYQRYFKEGKLTEPIPHLFIICDEFAELKSQQPEFMDNLISVARIGRSLGVHLILATQKPSGVVNDQIWSNTKFRVCLKVQDASDSKEMLKRPEAASIKQTGRFYLQVGYDEYFALGQSAWCGAKYYPSEKIIKQVDKSLNFIDDTGNVIKSIQSGTNIKIEPKGEQLFAILQNIIQTAKKLNKKCKRLWLNDIDPIILVDNLEKKYDVPFSKYDISAIIGEYDAPEKQEQGILQYSLSKDGNTIIYGNDEVEKENLLNAIIYSICTHHGTEEINIYAIDYGSEQLRMYRDFPQFGGIIYSEDDEGLKNLFKLIIEEIKTRKKMLVSYGGTFENYNNKNNHKLPQILFIINNYDGLLESYNSIYEDISSIGRDCERYGITLLITCNSPSSLSRRVLQCFNNKYALHLVDGSDYYGIFNTKVKVTPKDIFGRGLANVDGIHEFQTATIVPEEENANDYIANIINKINTFNLKKAKPIPTLPEYVSFEHIAEEISTLNAVPIGISKNTLKIITHDFLTSISTSISSNKLANINSFIDSLIEILLRINNTVIIFIDTFQILPNISQKTYQTKKVNYYNNQFDVVLDKLLEFAKSSNSKKYNVVYIIYGLERLKNKSTPSKIENLFNQIKIDDNNALILCDSTKNFKLLDLDSWYSKIKNNTDGIWIGNGFGEQQNYRISKLTKEMTQKYSNNYGFWINESSAELMKVINFNNTDDMEEDSND